MRIPAGKTSASFTVNTSSVSVQKLVTVTGTLNCVSQSATLTLNPPSLASVTVSLAGIAGATLTTGKVVITEPAPSGGMVNALTSSTKSATLPRQVQRNHYRNFWQYVQNGDTYDLLRLTNLHSDGAVQDQS